VRRISSTRTSLPRLGARRGQTAIQRLERAMEKLTRIDFFAGSAKAQAADALAGLKAGYRELFAGGEPRSSKRGLRLLDRSKYQKRIWATRKAPWVDRLASAWLIKRFIDREARFVWISRPSECPKNALGYDYDGADFTHVKNRVTYEVLASSFGLDRDPALAAIGAAVHFLDIGGIPVPDAKDGRGHAERRAGKGSQRRCAARRGDARVRPALQRPHRVNSRAITYALISAALFGASTPLAKLLVGGIAPLALAGLLYSRAGSARSVAPDPQKPVAGCGARRLAVLAAAVAAGGVLARRSSCMDCAAPRPLRHRCSSDLEAVFTAALAWGGVPRERGQARVRRHAGNRRRAACWFPGSARRPWPARTARLLIALACLAWALDNNLTRRASGGDAVTIAALKGLVAGAVESRPGTRDGGVSAGPGHDADGRAGGIPRLRSEPGALHHGAARARHGAHRRLFSVAPFYGAALALFLLGERAGPAFWAAAALMAMGVWLHVSERHEHDHVHEPVTHAHEHVHDEHHQHAHDGSSQASGPHDPPHNHVHEHGPLRHRHPHYPDLHHRHRH
jgi:hypothetical protein